MGPDPLLQGAPQTRLLNSKAPSSQPSCCPPTPARGAPGSWDAAAAVGGDAVGAHCPELPAGLNRSNRAAMENSSSYCPCTKPAASSAPSLWGTSKYLASFSCTVPEFIIWSPELLQSVIPSNWCDLALGHRVKLICRPAGRSRCPLHLRKVSCGFVCCPLQGAAMALGGTKEGGSLLHVMAPAGWQGGTATAGGLGTTPATTVTLPSSLTSGKLVHSLRYSVIYFHSV